MDSVREFLAMGGYAAFVWPAYGFAALVLAGLIWASVREMRRRAAELAEIEKLRPRRGRRGPTDRSEEVSGDA